MRFNTFFTLFALMSGVRGIAPPKVQICHVPPGNPQNFHSIRVSSNSVLAHLSHGDYFGSCSEFCDELCPASDFCHASQCSNNACLPEIEVDCSIEDLCLVDSCDPLNGCVYTELDCSSPDQCIVTGCDSESGCTEEPVNCNDNDVCTQDSCDSAVGCEHAPVNCDDGNACTFDLCSDPNGCIHFPRICFGTICETVQCNPVTGRCDRTPVICTPPTDPCKTAVCIPPVLGCVEMDIPGCVP